MMVSSFQCPTKGFGAFGPISTSSFKLQLIIYKRLAIAWTEHTIFSQVIDGEVAATIWKAFFNIITSRDQKITRLRNVPRYFYSKAICFDFDRNLKTINNKRRSLWSKRMLHQNDSVVRIIMNNKCII